MGEKLHYIWANKYAKIAFFGLLLAGLMAVTFVKAYGDHISNTTQTLTSVSLPTCSAYASNVETCTVSGGTQTCTPGTTAEACGCTVCTPVSGCNCVPSISIACSPQDCADVLSITAAFHAHFRAEILDWITDEMDEHEEWWEDTMVPIITNGMQAFAEQLYVGSMHQVFAIGTFFDAKHQLESQNLIQELQITAYEDYQPSESMCTFGTAVRSMAHTESAAKTAALALNTRQMARHLGNKNIGGANDTKEDKLNRWKRFTQYYCDPQDNKWNGQANSGLTSVCSDPPNPDPDVGTSDRTNIDIDYTRAIENRRMLDIYGGAWFATGDELDIMALGNNLYGHDVLSRNFGRANVKNEDLAARYHKIRSVAAKRSVAENSFNNIVGLRSQGSSVLATSPWNTNEYLGRILQDLGIPEAEVVEYLGIDPDDTTFVGPGGADASHLATLEILTKKIFQNPNFYANLYDTPANVKRKSAALKAFELMLDRAIYESQLRREMTVSILLSARLDQHKNKRPSALWGEQ